MRLLAAVLVLAATTAVVSSGSFSVFSDETSTSMALGSNPTFDPISTATPVVTGTVEANETLSVDANGDWWRSNVAITRSYQWQVCDSLVTSTCVDIPLATSSSYLLGAVPLGDFFRVVETATSTFGATTVPSGIVS